MIRVTWEWLGQGPALDLANTVAVVNSVERDLVAEPHDFGRWAAGEGSAAGLKRGDVPALIEARPGLLRLRSVIREALRAVVAGKELPTPVVAELNRASRAAPEWLELDLATARLRHKCLGSRADRMLAAYARSALRLIADAGERLHVCPAPSCGMFYRPRRSDQQWCSHQCGSRARFARHYRSKKMM